jgi:prepilin-type N-terminal cleavage/methylation domain-containing protein
MQKKGMSLLEVVAATLVITILAAGMFGAYVGAQFIFNRARHRVQAFNFAREAQDKLRANYKYTDSQMNNASGHLETEIGAIVQGELQSLGATLTYDVSEQANGYKEVVVRVSWTAAAF